MVTAIPHHLRRRHPVGTMSLIVVVIRPVVGRFVVLFLLLAFLLFLFLVVANFATRGSKG